MRISFLRGFVGVADYGVDALLCQHGFHIPDHIQEEGVAQIRRYDSDQTIGADVMLSFLVDFRFVTMFLRNFKHQSLCFGTDMCASGKNA